MKFITVHSHNHFEPMRVMAEDVYNNPDDDATVVLGFNNYPFSNYTKQGRLIVYQFEQIFNYASQWFNPNSDSRLVRDRTVNLEKWLKAADELWDYDADNVEFLKSLGYKNVVHKPLVYCDKLKFNVPGQHKIYDLVFFGSLNRKRILKLKYLQRKGLKIRVIGDRIIRELKYCSGPLFGNALYTEIKKAKAMLNLHYYDIGLQEQSRIFLMLINDIPVISEPSRRNYYGDLITEVSGEWTSSVRSFLEQLPTGLSEKFKQNSMMQLTQNSAGIIHKTVRKKFKVGACYNSFYGLELIEKSIESIRAVADEIIIVHQRVSFSGEQESPETITLIEQLKQKYNVMITPLLTSREQVVDKRNAGLEFLKSKGCDFVIPLDTDERYDAEQMRKEIELMWQDNTDTLYCPIRTFYHDEKHFFSDSYYVPAVYRINGRKFQKCHSSVIVDPLRKMSEGNFRISKMPMLHYSYLLEPFRNKQQSKVSNFKFAGESAQILNALEKWKPGSDALVFGTNSIGDLILVKRKLHQIDLRPV